MVQRLVLLGIAVLFSLGDGEVPDKGTCLAPAIKAEKIAGEDLLPTGAIFVSGKEEATEGAEAAASAIWPSQLESCRDSPSDSSSSRHDLVLQALRSSEQSELREMPLLSKALESGMGGLSEKAEAEARPASTKARHRKKQRKRTHGRSSRRRSLGFRQPLPGLLRFRQKLIPVSRTRRCRYRHSLSCRRLLC